MIKKLISTLIASMFLFNSASADESKKPYMESLSFNISYPLIASYSYGIILPLGTQETDSEFPSAFSLRADAEIGLGGGIVAIGTYIPAGSFAYNVKVSHMQTWLTGNSAIKDKSYNGLILELVSLGHLPGKIGLGYFKEVNSSINQQEEIIYFSIGVGW